jgi:hypothetical protein
LCYSDVPTFHPCCNPSGSLNLPENQSTPTSSPI